MTNKEQIIIDGENYNKCNGCKLWNGYNCTGDRSYEPNAEAHRAICNEHIAKEFWKVYHELFYKTQECKELKQTLTEIKEILEIHKDNKCAICPKFDECFEHPSCDNIILQKISECEVENDR